MMKALFSTIALLVFTSLTWTYVSAQTSEQGTEDTPLPVVTNDRPSFMAGRNGGFGSNDYGALVEPFGSFDFVETPASSPVPDFSRAQFSSSSSSSSRSSFSFARRSSSSARSFRSGGVVNAFPSPYLFCGDFAWDLPVYYGRDPLNVCIWDVGPDDTGVFGTFGF